MQARLALQRPSRVLTLISLFAAAAATLMLGVELGSTFKVPNIVQAPGKLVVVGSSTAISDDCYQVRHKVC
jgi:hypothetical protein